MTSQVSQASKDYKLSDHYDGTKFYNPRNHSLKSFWDVLKWKFTSQRATWPSWIENKEYDFTLIENSEAKMITTFINHATFLIQFPELNILTDPVFSDRTSPFTFLGPKRVRKPGLDFNQLPVIDVVLISHNHYDHLDVATLKKLDEKFSPLFLVPLGDKKLLKSHGLKNVQELDWWEEVHLKSYQITFAPAYHWSARGLFDKCESLWGAYYIKSEDYSIYFAGDTGYEGHFKETREKLGPPDLSLLPVGAWSPRWFMQAYHMDPNEAVMAHHDLGSKMSIGMHFGTFQLTDEGYEESQEMLKKITDEQGISESFILLDQGESFIK
ncbi:MAG TPA: MBL fold metallo-hydrolase [Bacteriovoracaceae bacterium]|nr:MBL fold metallo-hydrolase [Bacteriovoracaceae bacterium]